MVGVEMVRWTRKRETFILPHATRFLSALGRASSLSGLSMTFPSFFLSLSRLGCNTGLYGCVGNGSMAGCIVRPFMRW